MRTVQVPSPVSAQQIRAWRHHHKLTLRLAAEALGISDRQLIYFEQGAKPVPRSVWLAMMALENLPKAWP